MDPVPRNQLCKRQLSVHLNYVVYAVLSWTQAKLKVGKMGAPPPLFHHSVIAVQSATSAHFQILVKRQTALKITALQLASTQLSSWNPQGWGLCEKCLRMKKKKARNLGVCLSLKNLGNISTIPTTPPLGKWVIKNAGMQSVSKETLHQSLVRLLFVVVEVLSKAKEWNT